MKIVLTGAPGTGKTTLAKALVKKFNQNKYRRPNMKIAITGADKTGVTSLGSWVSGKRFTLLQEAATLALIAGFKLDHKVDVETELWIATKQLEMERMAGDNFVADRSFVDIHAYVNYYFHEDRALINLIGRIADKAMNSYDIVIHCPAGQFPIENNGVRVTSAAYQWKIDRRIKGTLALHHKEYHTVKGTLKERMAQVEEIIRKAGAI